MKKKENEFFKLLLSTEIKSRADGVKAKEGFNFRARIRVGSFSKSFNWMLKDTKIITGYLNVKTSFRLDNI